MNSVEANLLMFYGNIQHNHPFSQPLLPELRLTGGLLEPLPAALGQGMVTPWTSGQYNIYEPHWAHWILWFLITQPDSPCFFLSERFYLRQLIGTREAWKIERQSIFSESGTVSHFWVASEKQSRRVWCQILTQSAATVVCRALVNCQDLHMKFWNNCFFFNMQVHTDTIPRVAGSCHTADTIEKLRACTFTS